MKLPFPYAIAAEFVLFREWAKVTLPHILVPLSGVSVMTICYLIAREHWGMGVLLAGMIALLAAVVSGLLVFRLFCLVLPALRVLVRLGVVAIPNRHLMKRKVRSYCGHRE